jgi:transcriptional regulator with XRE-family HTH domain
MRTDADVWQALLHRKGLSVADLAGRIGVTRQHAHRLVTGRRPAGTQRDDLEAALALGEQTGGRPLYAIAELDKSGDLDLIPAGDAQPLFVDDEVARRIAQTLEGVSWEVCVVPVWPAYAWRSLVGFHAAWGAEPEPRKLFVADDTAAGVSPEAILNEIRTGLEATLRARAQARDPAFLREVEARFSGYTDARLPQ